MVTVTVTVGFRPMGSTDLGVRALRDDKQIYIPSDVEPSLFQSCIQRRLAAKLTGQIKETEVEQGKEL